MIIPRLYSKAKVSKENMNIMSSEDEGNARGGFRLFRIMAKLAQVKWQIVVTLFFAARFSMIFTKMVKGLVILYGGKMNSIKFWSISPSWEQK